MNGLLYAQFRTLLRRPFVYVIVTFSCVLFSFVMGSGGDVNAPIPVYIETNESQAEQVVDYLEANSSQTFDITEKSEVIRSVREGMVYAGLILESNSYAIVVAFDNPNAMALEQNVRKAYTDLVQQEKLRSSDHPQAEQVMTQLDDQLFSIKTESFLSETSFKYDSKLQAIFGMSVYFVVFTIAYNVIHLLTAKQTGIWDRMILSPTRKWEVYMGILMYAFILGYFQVFIIFSIFKWGLNVDFYDGFINMLILLIPYVLSIVSLSVFLAGISKNIQTFNTLVPLISVSLAMIGGAFWPIEVVTNQYLLLLAKIDPITYILDGLKKVTLYQGTLTEALYPMSILLFMSVLLMGIGINLMERRN